MQFAVVEFGRNVLKLKNANSIEMDPKTKHPVIHLMEEQKRVKNMGDTMRLGAYDCEIKKGTKAAAIYGKSKISERHSHRHEFNNDYHDKYAEAGMVASGIKPATNLVEIV